jgi:hypothetical protein
MFVYRKNLVSLSRKGNRMPTDELPLSVVSTGRTKNPRLKDGDFSHYLLTFPKRLSISEINPMFGKVGFALLRVKFKRHTENYTNKPCPQIWLGYGLIARMDNSLLPFFQPKGVVIVGASTSPEKLGYGVARNLIQSGYKARSISSHKKAAKSLEGQSTPACKTSPTPLTLRFSSCRHPPPQASSKTAVNAESKRR